MRNNKGYSLVELLISIAIFSLVMGGIISIMNTTSVFYRGGQQEVRLQEEAQIAINQIEELLIDLDNKIVVVDDSSGSREYEVIHKDNTGFGIRQDGDTLEFGRISAGMQTWELMAEGVEDFEITGFEYNGGSDRNVGDNRVSVSVGLKNGKYEYTARKDVYFRNAIENETVHTMPQSTTGGGASSSEEYDYEYTIRRGEKLNLFSEFDIVSSVLLVSGSSMQASQLFDVNPVTSGATGITENIVSVKGTLLASHSQSLTELAKISVSGKDSKGEDVNVLLLVDPVSAIVDIPVFQFTVNSSTNAGSPKWIEFKGIDFRGYSNLKYDMVFFSDNNGNGAYESGEEIGGKANKVSFGSPTNLYSGPNNEKINTGVRTCQNTGFAVVYQHNDTLRPSGATLLTTGAKKYLYVDIFNGTNTNPINQHPIILRALPHGAANGFE